MQTQTINGITLKYPDTPCMIFNPVPFTVSGTLARLHFYISHSGGSMDFYYETPNGGTVDIREYLQSAFTGLQMGGDLSYTTPLAAGELGKQMNFTVKAENSGGTSLAQFNLSLFCLWGALKAGEEFNQHRTVTWFMGFPFTVGYYAEGAQQVSVGAGTPQTVTNIASQGYYNILIDDALGGQYLTIYDIMGALAQASFDNTFDLTFTDTLIGTITERVRVRLYDQACEGVYLRWVSRQGFWNYWLFKPGSDTRNVGTDGTWYRNDLSLWKEIYHWQNDSGRRQNLTRNDVMPLCAPLVDSDTFEMLQDITTSPCVDMYMGKDANDVPQWTAVTIEAGSYTKEVRRPMQDFICNLVLPEIDVQKL